MKFEKYFDKKLKGNYWRFDATIGGHRYRRGGFLYKKDAEDAVAAIRLYAQRTAYGLPTNIPERTVGDLVTRLKADKTVARRVWVILQKFADHCGAPKVLRELGRADIKSFADNLRANTTLADSSYSQYMAQLKTALYKAGDYFSDLETWQPPKLPKLPGFNKRTRIVKPEEVGAFLRELANPVWHADRSDSFEIRRDLADIIRLMCLLGARREEIEKINMNKVDWEKEAVWLWSSKTKKQHLVPLSLLAIGVLERRAKKADQLFRRRLKSDSIIHTMNKAANRIGLTFGRKAEGWTLHDLRRTAAVLVENSGVPYSAVQDLLGHARPDMTATYTPAQMAALRQAVQVLENWCRQIDGFIEDANDLQIAPETSMFSVAA